MTFAIYIVPAGIRNAIVNSAKASKYKGFAELFKTALHAKTANANAAATHYVVSGHFLDVHVAFLDANLPAQVLRTYSGTWREFADLHNLKKKQPTIVRTGQPSTRVEHVRARVRSEEPSNSPRRD